MDPEKGRFRAFLLASLRHYLAHERDRDRALKRGGGATTLSLDVESAEDRYAIQAATAETPDEVFERRWAMTVLDKPPFHTLPHDELIAKLRSLTNIRVVRDPETDQGWKITLDPFPGWQEVPTWR